MRANDRAVEQRWKTLDKYRTRTILNVLSRMLPYIFLAASVVVATSSFWTVRGIPIFGDWVPPSQAYLHHLSNVWDPYERNGAINTDLRTLPWLGPLAAASGPIDGGRVSFVSEIFLVLAVALPLAIAFYVARRYLGLSSWQAVLGAILYAFNPWIAGQLAAGHLGIVLGYGLLPLVVVAGVAYRGWRFVLGAGALMAVMIALDLHVAFHSALILGTSLLCLRRDWRKPAVEVGGAIILTATLSAYWFLPSIIALGRIAHSAGRSSQSPGVQATLSQMADPLHVLTGRSNWWPQFSDGLVSYGSATWVIVAALLLLPTYILSRAILEPKRRDAVGENSGKRFFIFGLVLLLMGTLPQFFAHLFPTVYSALGDLPLGAVFRDVTDWTPLYLIGLACIAVNATDSGRWNWLMPAAAAAACVAVLLPWIGGDLRGDIRPLSINDGQLEAIAWLNQKASPDARILWLPLGPYQRFPWSGSAPVSDPTRYWSEGRLLNSITDPAYDFFPEVTTGLLNLDAVLAGGLEGSGLADILAHAGVRYVAVKTDVELYDVTAVQDYTLSHSQGIKLLGHFGSVSLYEVAMAPRPDVRGAGGLAFYDGSWHGLAHASNVDPSLKRVYISTSAGGSVDLLARSDRAVLSLGGSFWGAFFGADHIEPPPGAAGRERYPFDPGFGYAFEKGETFTFVANGIAAVRVLGADPTFDIECINGGVGQGERLVYEQPDSVPRWYVVRCNGIARARVGAHIFVQGFTSLDDAKFQRRLDVFANAMQRGGSAYVLLGPEFGPDIVALSGQFRNVTAATWRENPLIIPSGHYALTLRCSANCPGGAVLLYPFPESDWAGTAGAEFEGRTGFSGRLYRFDIGPNASGVSADTDITAGVYQALLVGVKPELVANLTLERIPDQAVENRTAPPLTQDAVRGIPPATMVAINEAPGPWSVLNANGRSLPLIPADVLGSAYFANGDSSTVSMLAVTLWAALGRLLSAMGLLFLIGIVCVAKFGSPLIRMIRSFRRQPV